MKNMPLNDSLIEQAPTDEKNGACGIPLTNEFVIDKGAPCKRDEYADRSETDQFPQALPGGHYCCRIEAGYPFLHISDQFLRLLGWSQEEIQTRFEGQFLKLVHPEDYALAQAYAHTACALENAGEDVGQIYRLLGKKGFHWVADNKTVITLGNETVVQGCVTDITHFLGKREKQRTEREAHQKEQLNDLMNQLDDERRYLEVLCSDYTGLYCLHMDRDTIIPLKVEAQAIVAQQPHYQKLKEYPYTQRVTMLCRRFVQMEDCERAIRMFSRENLAKHLQEFPRFTFRFKCMPTPKGYEHFEVQAIRMSDDPHSDVLLGLRHIDDLVKLEQRHQAELHAERQYLDVLCYDFTSVYRVNLKTNVAVALKVGEKTNAEQLSIVLRQEFPYNDVVENYAKKYLLRSGRAGFLQFMSLEHLSMALRSAKRCTHRYRCRPDPLGHQHFEVQVVRIGDDPSDCNVMIAFRPIDELVTAEQRHQFELEERLEQEQLQNEVLTALGQNYDAIFRINLLHDIYQALSCRDSIKHYYGDNPSATAMLAKMCEDIVAPTHYERMRRFFDLTTLAARLREREFIETECITKKGVWHRARLIVRRRDGKGNVTHVLYVTQIINDEKQYEEHLIARAEYADLANRSKSSFISQVAHDIRTPMNSIFGFLEIAEANLDNEQKVQYSLENIRSAGQFLKKLVDDVLDLSRMEDGKISIQPENASLTQMAKDMANTMQMEAKKKKQTFCLNVHDILHDNIVIDGLRFVQIHTNVLSNAVNYTPVGGSIEFDVHQEEVPGGDKVRTVAKIKDTGIGMSAETMSRMFDKFERGTDTRINKVSGYGLGLSIVKQLLDLMGGSIEARSMPGQGTTFTIRLETPYVQQTRREEEKTPIDAQAVCSGMHLLVAEDNDLNREVITELLAMYDITCECVENGALCVERLRTAQEGAFAAVLMDMQMPVMDGVEATRRIRALEIPWAKNLPIIAMTANAMKDDVQRCLEAGMDRHMSKPVDMMLMLKTLAEVVNERKMKG